MSDETFFSTNKRVCIKSAAIKVNHDILTGGSKGQCVLGHEIIVIAFRVNKTGSFSQPPRAHQGSPPAPKPTSSIPRSDGTAGTDREGA